MKLFLVSVMRTPGFDPALGAAHAAFLDRLRSDERIERAGAFVDKSGGACLLRTESLETAGAIAERDPLHVGSASRIDVPEWDAR